MKKIKNWFHGTWISLTMALGVQYVRPPVMDDVKPPIEAQASPTPTPIEVQPPTQVQAKVPQMKIKFIRGATDEEIIFIRKGIDDANKVLASDWFKVQVLKASFTETNGLTNGQIYNKLAERPIEVGIEMFYGSWKQNYIYKTMGYDIGDGVVYMNRFYVDTAPVVGSLSTHEGEGHGQGFHHYGVFATSVPYTWNDIIEEGYKVLRIK